MMPPRLPTGPNMADPSQFMFPGAPPRFPGNFAAMGGGAGRGGSYGYAPRPMPGVPNTNHMYTQPVQQMYNNPTPTKGGGGTPQGGPRQMASGKGGQAPGSYMGSGPPGPVPQKPASRAIAIVNPTTHEVVNADRLNNAEAPSAAPAITPPVLTPALPAPAQAPSSDALPDMSDSSGKLDAAQSQAPSDSGASAAASTEATKHACAAPAPPFPAPEATPAPEVTPAPEAAPAPETAPAPEAASAPEAAPAPMESPTPIAAPLAAHAPAPAPAQAPALAPAPPPAPALVPEPDAAPVPAPAPEPAPAPVPTEFPSLKAASAPETAPAPSSTVAPEKLSVAPANAANGNRVPTATSEPQSAPVTTSANDKPSASEETKENDDSGDDWESKDESQLLIEPVAADKPKGPPVSLRPGGGMAFASSTKVSAASASGKKVYDRDFLLQFQAACNKKPEGLPDMEVFAVGPGGEPLAGRGRGAGTASNNNAPQTTNQWGRGSGPPPGKGGSAPGFPDPRGANNAFAKGSERPRGGDRRDAGRSGKGGPRAPPFMETVKPLVQSENRWKPADPTKVDNLEKLLRTTKALLNKFTPEKRVKLTEQFLELEIHSHTDMMAVIDLVFDKALFEPIFGFMYAELCVRCSEKFPEFKDEDNPTAKPHTFKRLLLNKCQEEFEKENGMGALMAELGEDASAEERENLRKKTKSRMLGNIRFIGELYKQKMLTEKIMHECLIKLLGEVQNPDEDEIECLCKLLLTIGKMIDHPKAKLHMDQYFARMQEMAQNPNLPNRMRFMLQETIELRRGQWIARKPVAAPPSEDPGKGKGGRIQAGSGDIRKEIGGRSMVKGAAPQLASRGGRGAGDDGFTAVGSKGGRGVGSSPGDAGKAGEASTSAPSAAAPSAPPPPKKLSKDELEEKIEGNLEEYFSGAGVDELMQCTRDLQPKVTEPDELGIQLVQATMRKCFDARSSEQRSKCYKVLGALFKAKLIKSAQASTVLNETLEFIEDEICDVPHVGTYMAEFIAAAIQDGALKLSFINDAFSHLVTSETLSAAQMACSVLSTLRTSMNDDAKLRRMYADEVQLNKCLPPDRNSAPELAQLLESKGLAFLDPKLGAEVAKAREEQQLRDLESYLKGKLGDVDGDNACPDEELITWMGENSSSTSATARTVMRCVLQTVPPSFFEEDIKGATLKLCKGIERRQKLLKKVCVCTDSIEQRTRQAQLLFAFQNYCVSANWPQGLTKSVFYKLYDCDIVFEEAFEFWREDTQDPTPGKTTALIHAREFIQWLEEAQEDGEDEEGEDA